MVRVLYLVVGVLLFEVFFIPGLILGALVFPLAWRYAPKGLDWSILSRKGIIQRFDNRFLDAWFGNREDGLIAFWWRRDHPEWGEFRLAYTWFLRNPLANLRYIKPFGFVPIPKKIRSIDRRKDGFGWYLAWQGFYTCWMWQTKKFKVWIGWKLKPEDVNGIDDWRAYGVSCGVLAR